MSKPKPVSFGPDYWDGWLAILVLVAGVALAALFAMLSDRQADRNTTLAWAGVEVVAVVLAVVRADWIRRSRWWLTATEDGFILTDDRQEFSIPDEAIVDLGVVTRTVPIRPTEVILHRDVRFAFRSGSGVDIRRFSQKLSLGKTDHLGPALERVLEGLVRRTIEKIEPGGLLVGEGWKLSRDGLSLAISDGTFLLPLAEVAAVDWIDEAVCVWAAGRDEVILRAKATTTGATVLFRVLRVLCSRVPDAVPGQSANPAKTRPRPARTKPAGDKSRRTLGRLIFSKEPAPGLIDYHLIVGAAIPLALGGLIWFVRRYTLAWDPLAGLSEGMIGLVVALIATIVGWVAWVRGNESFRCYENGIQHRTWLGTTTLLFSEVGSFTYAGTRRYVNWEYTGTELRLEFSPLDRNRKAIQYHTQHHFDDTKFDTLRDNVARVIAGHMLERLHRGEPIKWTPRLVLQPDGLFVRPRSGSREGRLVPYDRVGSHTFDDGVFYLRTEGDAGQAIEERVSRPNFFPGYFVLLALTGPPAPWHTHGRR